MTELTVIQARCAVDIDLFFTIASHHLESAKGPKVRSGTCPGRGQQLGNQNIVTGLHSTSSPV